MCREDLIATQKQLGVYKQKLNNSEGRYQTLVNIITRFVLTGLGMFAAAVFLAGLSVLINGG